jgi:predicted anti-sigma-YlaC factor YlaD
MAKLDRAKEEIAYLRLWLGLYVIVDIGLASWLFTGSENASSLLISSAVLAVIAISVLVYLVHITIEVKIATLEEL